MKTAFGSVLVVAALVAVPAPTRAATPQTSAVKASDKTLDERIEKRPRDRLDDRGLPCPVLTRYCGRAARKLEF